MLMRIYLRDPLAQLVSVLVALLTSRQLEPSVAHQLAQLVEDVARQFYLMGPLSVANQYRRLAGQPVITNSLKEASS